MKRSWKWTVFAGGLVALCGAFITGRSWADGIPATGALAYSGRLEAPTGDPLTGSRNLEVKLWDAASDGNSLCPSNSRSVTLEQGRFTLNLLDECTDAVQANADVWVEILVDGTSLGRTKTGAVPYAVEASHATTADLAGSADTLGALAPGDVQERVTGMCNGANQSIKSINADGTVTCETDDNTTYTAGSGISVSGTTISIGAGLVTANHIAMDAVGSVEIDDDAVGPADIGPSAVRQADLAGTEIEVFRKHASCGGGLTDLTTCNTLPCNDDFPLSGGLFYLDCNGDCSIPAPDTCNNPTARVGYLLSPSMPAQ